MKTMLLSPRVTIDKKSKILALRLRKRGPVDDMQIQKKVVISYDKNAEVVGIYLLPFSYDEFCPTQENLKPTMASAPAAGV